MLSFYLSRGLLTLLSCCLLFEHDIGGQAMQEQVLMGEKMLERLFQDLKASATYHPENTTSRVQQVW